MAGMKPQRRRLTARQQHTERPVTTPRLPSTALLSATAPRLQLITSSTVENYTELPKYYYSPSYTTLTEAAMYYVASTFYTTAAPSYYAEPKYYTEAPAPYYTTTYATLCYYTEAPKCYSAPSYYTVNASECIQLTTVRFLNIRAEFVLIFLVYRFSSNHYSYLSLVIVDLK
jgi:hypothetical protein